MMSSVPNDGGILHQMKLFSLGFAVELNTVNWCFTYAVTIFCSRHMMTYILHITKTNFKVIMPSSLLSQVLSNMILLLKPLVSPKPVRLPVFTSSAGNHSKTLWLSNFILVSNQFYLWSIFSHLFFVASLKFHMHFVAPTLGSDHTKSGCVHTPHKCATGLRIKQRFMELNNSWKFYNSLKITNFLQLSVTCILQFFTDVTILYMS